MLVILGAEENGLQVWGKSRQFSDNQSQKWNLKRNRDEYLAGEITGWFSQGEASTLHSVCTGPCDIPKCGKLDCIICGSRRREMSLTNKLSSNIYRCVTSTHTTPPTYTHTYTYHTYTHHIHTYSTHSFMHAHILYIHIYIYHTNTTHTPIHHIHTYAHIY